MGTIITTGAPKLLLERACFVCLSCDEMESINLLLYKNIMWIMMEQYQKLVNVINVEQWIKWN